jgi:peptidoglycan/xylan/chitin deacetylase (PgdA/CDA1 family)
MAYWVRMPWWLRKLLPSNLVWRMPETEQPAVYLTFDDGPHPTITPFVLQQLETYDAKATFFCIGKNVVEHPDVYRQVVDAGHSVGNHTHNHKNGWKTKTQEYLDNIMQAEEHIDSRLFRPPYGRITRVQAHMLAKAGSPWKIYMWDVLSADFDKHITPEKCLENVLFHIRPGSIVVFHDSEKAYDRMSFALPRVLAFCRENGWQMKGL